ncbi:TPA: hypothetical protein SMM89_000541 [Proteus mirabilis]|uniref:hypothetical protein n=1 Tax=Proteus mirabilis TaxID=584 RepID=UPI000D993823|nr:hypothetical protein [Proteus mirabilis]MBG6002512.1 hypothetical protein [Proteus mirabilis]MBI6248869.1 hypothetical protein [Proteus mirabilis]SPY45012.1 Uncharacterised protein [Proteus mirabilis]HEJ9467449.1 hypothetical protein [Proteus mirabilis]HEK0526994.1 hypothetical protein [Proteus mirabilis]
MKDKYYAGLENYKDCIEIEPTIKDKFNLKSPSWDISITKQDLVNIKLMIEEILENE